MAARHRRLGAAALVATLFVATALLGTSLAGDSAEYILMARAFVSHGSPEIRSSDIAWLYDVLSLRPGHFKLEGTSLLAATDGRHYAIHFWMYSLLAAPFLAIGSALKQPPTVAFAVLNALFLFGAVAYVHRRTVTPAHSLVGAAAVLVCGGTFYSGWIGPEAMTASAALIACVAALKCDLVVGSVAAGFAATQNPSAAAILPYVWVSSWWTGRAVGATLPVRSLRVWGAVAVALVLIASPYAFFKWKFGLWSLIAGSAIDSHLIGGARLWSLLFDLNQGMVMGTPGLMLSFLAVAGCSLVAAKGAARRLQLAVTAALAVGCLLVLVAPLLAQRNWNADIIVMMRYAYWPAAPLLAVTLALMPALSRRAFVACTAALVVPQLGILGINGVWGQNSYYLRHGWLADWVLRHHPAAYNPVPEIFRERTVKDEVTPTLDLVVHYPARGWATKIMSHWAQPVDCAWYGDRGRLLASSSTTRSEGGYLYFNAPFDCKPASELQRLVFRPGIPTAGITLGNGWSLPEPDGVWSEGRSSVVTIRLPSRTSPRMLRFYGHYYTPARATLVVLSGRELGKYDLSNAEIDIPAALAEEPELALELRHPHTLSPRSIGESADQRELAFFLRALGVN